MSYTLVSFGGVALPTKRTITDVGAGDAKDAFQELPGGGVYDGFGSDEAPEEETVISHTGTLVGSTDINLSAQSRTLKAVHRTEGVLVRALPDGTQEWCIARMTGFRSTRSVKNTRHLEIALKFKKKSANWNGENYFSWKLDSGYKLDTGLKLNSAAYQFTLNVSPKTVVVNNGGNAAVRNCIITVTAGTAAITALTIAISGVVDIDYTGTIAAGESLVVDCGAFSVENNGTPDSAHWILASGHASEDWLPLEKGDNSVVVTKTGGDVDSVIKFEFYDGWK